jgi:AcrR family transcriptional regulator
MKNSLNPDGRRARGDATRARVLRVARKIASLQGLDGVTIGQVAEAAKMSKGHLAQLCGDREALQLATLDSAAVLFATRIVGPANAASTAAERLRRYCLGWFEYVEDRVLPGGCLITAATSEFRTIPGAVRNKLIGFRQRTREYLHEAIVASVAERSSRRKLRESDIDDLIYQIFAYRAAANIASLLGDAPAFAHARRTTAELLDALTEG